MAAAALEAALAARLDQARANALYRDPEEFASKSRSKRLGRLIDFSSNDYLGLSCDPRVAHAAARAVKAWGAGSSASRLLSGNLKLHLDLERSLAAFKKEESAKILSSGYLANLCAISVLAGSGDVILLDRYCHASIVDGARLSGAKLWVYPHRDVGRLRELLSRARSFRRRLIITESYFSMDGDVAPLKDIWAAARESDSLLLVDEAHAMGVYGPKGSGWVVREGLSGQGIVTVGTLSKAIGSVGGYIAGRDILGRSVVNFGRPYIYTTAPVPAASAAALASIALLRKGQAPLDRLWKSIDAVRQGLAGQGWDLMGSEGPIIPVRVGDPQRVMAYKRMLMSKGLFVAAIRTPTVPRGTDRLRISVSAAHTSQQIRCLVKAMASLRKRA